MGKTYTGKKREAAKKNKIAKRKACKVKYGIFILLPMLVLGCGKAVSIAFTDSTGVSVGTITLQETTFPMVSYSSGPRFFATVAKDCESGFRMSGFASITNRTHALGVYDSDEIKSISLDVVANSSCTNSSALNAD